MRRLIRIIADLRPGTVLLPWLAAAVGILTFKFWRLHKGGFHETALFLGHPGKLRICESLTLFRGDLLLLFLLIPVAILLLTWRLSRRAAIHTCAWLAASLVVLTAFQLNVWSATGSFTSLRMTWELMAWELAIHDFGFLTVYPHILLGTFGILLLVALLTMAARDAVRRSGERVEYAALAGLAAACLLGIVCWIPRVPAGPWTPPLLSQCFYSFFLQTPVETWEAKHLEAYSAPQLIARYRAEPHVVSPQPSPYFGTAQNANLVIFTMESMSAHALDPARDTLADMPNLRRLRDHAFVMGRHYTSFPLTNYALFSMLTSVYAGCYVACSGDELVQEGGPQLPSLMRVLDGAGYHTAFYGYVWRDSVQRDDVLLKSLGFESLRGPAINAEEDRAGVTTFFGPIQYTEKHDLQALGMLRSDIRQWTAAHQRFAVMYFPEIGHDPYRGLHGFSDLPPLARGHALAVLQDAWLGQIIDELQEDGVLDNTIIVVTGDHGMRYNATRADGKRTVVANGKLDDVTMRVPMLIYVPQALHHTVYIDYPTSHIDIMPTLLDLMGKTEGQTYEQGSTMLDPRLQHRRLYLLMGVFGASGFYDDGSYYMLTPMGGVYQSNRMSFSDSNALLYNSRESESARRVQLDHNISQAALLDRLLHQGF